MHRKIEQPATEVWRGDDGMICIKQMADLPYSDEACVIVIHPLILPHIVTWLQTFLAEAQPDPEA